MKLSQEYNYTMMHQTPKRPFIILAEDMAEDVIFAFPDSPSKGALTSSFSSVSC